MIRKIITYTFFIGIAVLFTWLSYLKLTEEKTIGEVWEEIKQANYFYVILSMVMGYLAIVSRGIRWKYLLEPLSYKPKTWNSIHSVAIAYLSNLAVPRSGEVARCTSLYSTDGIPVDKLIGTVISERIIDFIFLFFFMAIAIGTNLDAFSKLIEGADLSSLSEKKGLLVVLGIVVVGGIVGIYIFRKRLMELNFVQKIRKFMAGIKDGVLAVKTMKKKWLFLAHTVFIWGMYAAMAIVVFQAKPETIGILVHEGLFIMVAGGFGMVLPSPGGTGTYQYAVSLAFLALGMSQAVGLQYGFLVWVAQTVMMIVGGFIGFFMLMRSRSKEAVPVEG